MNNFIRATLRSPDNEMRRHPVVRVPVVVLLLALTSCLYEDNYQLTPPKVITSDINFPGIASVRLEQSAPTSPISPAATNKLTVSFKSLYDSDLSGLTALVMIYKKKPFILDNLGYVKLIAIDKLAPGQEKTMDLGTSYDIVLSDDMIAVKLLDSGMPPGSQHPLRGYYKGTHYLSAEGERLNGGNVDGFIDYNGDVHLEVMGGEQFRFIEGTSVNVADSFEIYSSLKDVDSKVVSPFNGSLTNADGILSCEIHVVVSPYEELQLSLTQSR